MVSKAKAKSARPKRRRPTNPAEDEAARALPRAAGLRNIAVICMRIDIEHVRLEPFKVEQVVTLPPRPKPGGLLSRGTSPEELTLAQREHDRAEAAARDHADKARRESRLLARADVENALKRNLAGNPAHRMLQEHERFAMVMRGFAELVRSSEPDSRLSQPTARTGFLNVLTWQLAEFMDARADDRTRFELGRDDRRVAARLIKQLVGLERRGIGNTASWVDARRALVDLKQELDQPPPMGRARASKMDPYARGREFLTRVVEGFRMRFGSEVDVLLPILAELVGYPSSPKLLRRCIREGERRAQRAQQQFKRRNFLN